MTQVAAQIDHPTAPPNWTAQVLTILPEAFPGPLGLSLAGKGLEAELWALDVFDLRDFATDKHRTVDDAPFGGGPGMVIRPDIVARALDEAVERHPSESRRQIYLSPRGTPLTQQLVKDLSKADVVTLICGRFEGMDERVLQAREIEEVSLGDFILSGGEPAAIALIDAVVRLQPGVIGDHESLSEESFEGGLLEYPQYTRPRIWEGMAVPDVLISGHHERVREWRKSEANKITEQRRPDLWQRTVECRKARI
ncbi:MAG: tRNA (guanosine(37)-N1)-methyltransferase TrmD [Alphaproteobacteria bacterium]|nr:tRNA (guanosine(37)-N1)-methyltransferase TrmD [Alphaproteobacteria bacterium]